MTATTTRPATAGDVTVQRLTITLCGSLGRAAHDLARVHWHLHAAGHEVYAPVPAPPEADPSPTQIENIVAKHMQRIDRSDLVIAVIPDGVIGHRTGDEMRRAERQGISTRYDTDVDALIADITAGRLLDGTDTCPRDAVTAVPVAR
ncbi:MULTISPECIES: hypothetical protein [unclassified Micromonospora]|uniref:hypothetical protein n=1 Tax=unclassified Micromonospora TaxID=2617518 RepID=UPI00331BB707